MYGKWTVLICMMFFCLGQTVAAEFVEGRHYIKLSNTKTRQAEVTEYFSFFCSHCYNQQLLMKDIAKSLPRRVKFERVHVDGVPGQNTQTELLLTKALVTATKLKVEDKIVNALFKAINVQKRKVDDDADVRALFLANGVNAMMFDNTFGSYSVESLYEEALEKVAKLRLMGEKGIPTLVVNGKYKPVAARITSVGEYKELISYLLKKR